MPLLRNGRLSDSDPWVRLADDQASLPSPSGGASPAPLAVGLERFLAEARAGTPSAAGVWLHPDDDVLALAPHVGQLLLVVVEFPSFTDGRAFSQARLLRERLGFGGEVRAVGDVRPDHLPFMMRAGIDAFAFDESPDELLLQRALSRYRTSYQPSYTLSIAG